MTVQSMLSDKIITHLRDVPDFPRPGIVFKDITPLLADPELLDAVIDDMASQIRTLGHIDAIVGIEARGFIFGALLASRAGLPFIPIRKAGKLPWKTKTIEYALEYGTATIEIHEDAIQPEQRVVIVDDLLATGGTAEAAAKLVKSMNGIVAAYLFVIELGFLSGRQLLETQSQVISLCQIK